MASYKIFWLPAAEKDLRKLPKATRLRVLKAVDRLREEPLPAGSRKLQAAEHSYRLRVGDYRVVYSWIRGALVVEVIRVAHRKKVYRRLR